LAISDFQFSIETTMPLEKSGGGLFGQNFVATSPQKNIAYVTMSLNHMADFTRQF
jgi:hypothetical protein